MADQQPGDITPAAGLPDDSAVGPTSAAGRSADSARSTAGGVADPERQDGTARSTEAGTVPAPERWSGAAAVPPPAPKRGWWSRRRPPVAPPEVPPPSDEPTDWAATPPVDPWAGHDTPWDPFIAVPVELPPTRLDPGPAGALPPMPPAPPAGGSAPTASPGNAPTRPRRWGRRKERDRPQQSGTAGQRGATAPDGRPGSPAAASPPPATPGSGTSPAATPGSGASPAATPGSMAPPAGPAARPPVQAAWRPPNAVAPPAWRTPAARPAPLPAARSSNRRPPTGPPNQQAWPVAEPRRRRRWPRRLALVTLLGVVCCCGIPAGYLTWVPAGQFPVTAVLPPTVADLSLRDDTAGRRAAARLKQQLRDAKAPGKPFAGVYTDGNGKRVTIFGTTGLRVTPKQDVEAELRRLADQFGLRDVRPYDLGETGAHERCGIGTVDGGSVVVCGWADHGSLGTVVANRRSLSDSAELTGIMRSAVLTHG